MITYVYNKCLTYCASQTLPHPTPLPMKGLYAFFFAFFFGGLLFDIHKVASNLLHIKTVCKYINFLGKIKSASL